MTITTTSSGRISSGDPDSTLQPRVPVQRAPVVYCHSASASPHESVGVGLVPSIREAHQRMVQHGFSIVAPYCALSWGTAGTSSGFGLSGRISAAVQWHRNNLMGSQDPVVLVATSMGTLNALQYAAANPGGVACIAAAIPALDLLAGYAANREGLAASMANSWGVTSPNPLPAQADPLALMASVACPVRFWYATDDPWTPAALVSDFESAGAEFTSVGALGHTDAAVQAVNEQELVNFVQEHAVT